MDYCFNIEHAKKYGVDEAIMLHNLIYWIRVNKANNRNQHDGRAWTWNTLDAFAALFPFWNRDKIFRILRSLEKQNVLRKGNYNKRKGDRTRWYALEDESLLQLPEPDEGDHIANMQNAYCENATALPYINTDINKDKKETSPAATFAPSSLAPSNGNGQGLHMRTRKAFELGNGGPLDDYGKEGKCINKLISLAKKVDAEGYEDVLRQMLETFKELKETRRETFWNEAPFTPSALCGRWTQVKEILRKKGKDKADMLELDKTIAEVLA